MKFQSLFTIACLSLFVFFGCKNPKKDADTIEAEMEDTIESPKSNIGVYQVEINGINTSITNSDALGKGRFVIDNEFMHVSIEINGTPPNMAHWQHFHGFADGREATCPTMDDDSNGDGIIDLLETEAKAGTTMIPLNAEPADLSIPTETYPVSDESGFYHYEASIALEALEENFKKAFGENASFDLDQRVLFIHGIPADQELPHTVGSLGDIPAQKTIPIACGKIIRIE